MQSKFSKFMLCLISSSHIMASSPSITISYPANGSTITNHQPTVSGTVHPNIGVDLKIDGITSSEGTRTVPNKWHIKSSTVLATGSHTAVATVTTTGGKTAKATSTFTVSSVPSKTLKISSPKNGSTVSAPLVIRGTATAGSKVTLKLTNVKTDKISYGSVTANSLGFWSFTPARAILGKNVVEAISGSSTAFSTFTLIASTSSTNSSCNSCKPCNSCGR